MARTVIAFRLKDRTETQTDIAPSLTSAVATAPAVIEARKAMNMVLLWGWWNGSEWGNEKAPRVISRGRLVGTDGMGPACPLKSNRPMDDRGVPWPTDVLMANH